MNQGSPWGPQFLPNVLLIDSNGDGFLDIIAGADNNSGGSFTPVYAYALGNGAGNFASAQPISGVNGKTRSMTFADVDANGSLDILATTQGGVALLTSTNANRPDLSGQTLGVDGPLVFAAGQNSLTATVTNNHISEPAVITAFSVDGDSPNPDDFSTGTETCTAGPVASGGGTCQVEILFAPGDAGARAATILIASDIPASPTPFQVQGSGAADFGDAGNLGTGKDYTPSTVLPDGARHLATGPILGTYRDAESDGLADATAHGDDHTPASPDDEDGVTFPFNEEVGVLVMAAKSSTITPMAGVLISESTVGLTVTLSGATTGYLNAWLDWSDGSTGGPNGSFDDNGEHVIPNYQLSAGVNTVPVVLPEFGGPDTAVMRFRLTEASVAEPSPIGLEATGEVEDHLVSLKTGPQPIAPQGLGSGSVGLEGGNLVMRNGDGVVVSSLPLGSVSSLTITGDESDETITLDWDLVAAIPSIEVNLGGGFDALVINPGTGSPGTIEYNHTDATSGTITDGSNTLTFTGLDPIVDNGLTATRVFTFTADNETIILSPDGDGFTDNGMSYIDGGAAEEVSFVNPTSTLTVNTANGTNSVLLGLLDTDVDAGFTGVTANGGTGSDTFTATPASYPITIDGAGEGVGECDGLLLDLSGGAVVDVFTYDSGTGAGSYTFSSGHADITFTDIESVGSTELSIAANLATIYATQDLTTAAGNELIITVTNEGAMDANCVTVELSQALADFLDGEVGTESTGTLAGTTWTIPLLEAGEDATLTITGLVDNVNEGALTFILDALQDTDLTNNTASVVMSFGFPMPPKTHVNAALYYSKSTTGGAYDALIIGLYQGSPGIDGAVWCKVPDTAVGSWPTIPAASIGDLFRPCSNGLPHPLHVNDLFEDESGTMWLATWGNAGLYKSEDGGESWTDVEPILGPKSGWANVYTIIEDELDGTLYISANNGLVFRSLNDGDSWQQVGSLPGVSADTPWSMTAHPSEPGTIYAGTFGNGVFVSEDFGFTWTELDDDATVANENDDLRNVDATGDDFAGHIFDLEFSPDLSVGGDHVLYAGTGKGLWQAEIAVGTASTFVSGWTQNGPTVTLDDLSTVTPEVRTLAFVEDGGDTDDNLVAGTWGFGAFEWVSPNAGSTPSEVALKEGEITFVAVSPTGGIFLGASSGATALLTASSGTSTASEPQQTELPEGYALGQNYPNPFNPVTTIGFSVPETGRVKLSVFDGLGREVAVLVDGTIEAGHHEARFDAKSLPTGAYLYRLSTDAGAIARTLILMK
ncbi:MAG: T9SS type A sorting domain-containing protein [Rhodothermales bacterium]|nr:T9SS type A sorting domain-containing protein [Rhodothermales bacterium]